MDINAGIAKEEDHVRMTLSINGKVKEVEFKVSAFKDLDFGTREKLGSGLGFLVSLHLE